LQIGMHYFLGRAYEQGSARRQSQTDVMYWYCGPHPARRHVRQSIHTLQTLLGSTDSHGCMNGLWMELLACCQLPHHMARDAH